MVSHPINGMAICAGIGGLELSLHIAWPVRYRTVCYVERDAYAASALVARMEDQAISPAPVWDDLATFNSEPWSGSVDVLSAGIPCQPWSVAGDQEGAEDERWIWSEVARLLGEVEPRIVFLENVPQIRHGGLGWVLGDLADLGYDAEWGVLPAGGVGAPHQRKRFFLLGYRDHEDIRWAFSDVPEGEDTDREGDGGAGSMVHTEGEAAGVQSGEPLRQAGQPQDGPDGEILRRGGVASDGQPEASMGSDEAPVGDAEGSRRVQPGRSEDASGEGGDGPGPQHPRSDPLPDAGDELADAPSEHDDVPHAPADRGEGVHAPGEGGAGGLADAPQERLHRSGDGGQGGRDEHPDRRGQVADAAGRGGEGSGRRGELAGGRPDDDGEGMADASSEGLEGSERREAYPRRNGAGSHRPVAQLGGTPFPPWPPAPGNRRGWRWILRRWPSLEPALRRVADGSPYWMEQSPLRGRSDRLRGLGNAVVPIQGAIAIELLAERAVRSLTKTADVNEFL